MNYTRIFATNYIINFFRVFILKIVAKKPDNERKIIIDYLINVVTKYISIIDPNAATVAAAAVLCVMNKRGRYTM